MDTQIWKGPQQFDGTATFTATAVFTNPPTTYADDVILALGTTSDQALVNRSTVLNANTALTGVVVGTPVTPAVAANSLIVGNVTADGDHLFMTQTGGNSHAYLWYDTSAAILRLYSGAGVEAIKIDNGATTITGSLRRAGAGFLGLGAPEAVTIATGVATVTKPYVILDAEGAGTSDTLDSFTYTGVADGDLLLCTVTATDTITFDNSSTMLLGAATRVVAPGGSILFIYKATGTAFVELAFLTAAS